METIIYGGSFNPPTRAHQAIINRCLKRESVEEVWVMPSGERDDKLQQLADEDRLRMLNLMKHEVFHDDPRLVISRFELDNLPRPTHTWRTVQALEQVHPDRDFRFLFGADSLATMPEWDHGTDLRRSLGMLIIPRAGIHIEQTPNIEVLPSIGTDEMSSTEVRTRVAYRAPIQDMVCTSVHEYIGDSQLYATEPV